MTDAVLASAKTQVFAASLPLTHRDLLRLATDALQLAAAEHPHPSAAANAYHLGLISRPG